MCVRASIEKLNWDSEFFAMPIAKLTDINRSNSPFLISDALNDYKLVQAKIAVSDYFGLAALQNLGFQVIDGETDFVIDVAENVSDGDNCLLLATESDLPQLKKLAGDAFRLSRFRSPWFDECDNRRFYGVWAENAVSGAYDDCCLIIKDSKQLIKGFVTLRQLNGDEARIGLLAVNPDCQKQGIGQRLVNGALDWCRNRDKRRLRIATQTGNIGAQRLYIKCNATVADTSYWLYRTTEQ